MKKFPKFEFDKDTWRIPANQEGVGNDFEVRGVIDEAGNLIVRKIKRVKADPGPRFGRRVR